MGLGPAGINKALDVVGSAIEALPSSEGRGQALAALTTARSQSVGIVLDYESSLFDARASIIEAEAKSESTLTRIWRPVLMLGFGFIVFYNMVLAPLFGIKPLDAEAANITPELWSLLKLGIGGYVIGRSGEKITKSVAPVFKSGPEDLMKPKQLAKLRRKLAELEG